MLTYCPFCERVIDEPTAFEQVRPCDCGALYWLEFPDDLADAALEAMRELGVQSAAQIEIKVIRDYDFMLNGESQPIEEGVEVCLVFARLKSF